MDTKTYYDMLIDQNDDPVHDPAPLREYMDQWDGQALLDALRLTLDKHVLEIGVGTGRLAVRVAPRCGCFTGIDLSPKTILRAKENLSGFDSVTLLCGDFLTYVFSEHFDVIYSSLTFLHIKDKDKRAAVCKVASLLCPGGRFVLSLDKNQSKSIDYGTGCIEVYPDDPDQIYDACECAHLTVVERFETKFAHLMVAERAVHA